MAFTCPYCGMTSHNPNDEREQYCGNCHLYVGEPLEGYPPPKADQRVESLTSNPTKYTVEDVVCQHTARNPLANGDEVCLNCGIVL